MKSRLPASNRLANSDLFYSAFCHNYNGQHSPWRKCVKSAVVFYKSYCTYKLAGRNRKSIYDAVKLPCLRGSLTFSVTPRTLMASLTWWWMFFCISSSHTHRPRLHTAMHLNDGRTVQMCKFKNNTKFQLYKMYSENYSTIKRTTKNIFLVNKL